MKNENINNNINTIVHQQYFLQHSVLLIIFKFFNKYYI